MPNPILSILCGNAMWGGGAWWSQWKGTHWPVHPKGLLFQGSQSRLKPFRHESARQRTRWVQLIQRRPEGTQDVNSTGPVLWTFPGVKKSPPWREKAKYSTQIRIVVWCPMFNGEWWDRTSDVSDSESSEGTSESMASNEPASDWATISPSLVSRERAWFVWSYEQTCSYMS